MSVYGRQVVLRRRCMNNKGIDFGVDIPSVI